MTDEPSNDLDDFLDSIGLDVKPLSPEHALMLRLDSGTGYKQIHTYRYYIRWELLYYYHLISEGLELVKNTVDKKNFDPIQVRADKYDWVRVRTKWYLYQKHLPWFDSDQSGLGIADIDKMTQMIMEHEDIKPVIDANEEDLPRN